MRRVLAAPCLSLLAVLALVPVAQAATLSARIVGGQPAGATDVPWQALVLPKGYLCGGSVLDTTHVITAAHCVYDETNGDVTLPSDVTVRAGTLQSDPYAADGQTRSVTAVAVDPAYDPNTFNNDAAVLTVSPAFSFGPTVQPIDLVDAGFPTPSIGTGDLRVSGWGTTGAVEPGKPNYSKASPVLKRTTVQSAGGCTNYIGFNPAVQVCAGGAGTDACQGDSGGPLAIQDSGGVWKLAGIVSAGAGCAWLGYPGLYTRVGNAAIHAFLSDRSGDAAAAANPVNTAPPTIIGTVKTGARVTCSPGTWNGARYYHYRFVAGGQTLVDGASEVTLSQGAANQQLTCEVTAKSLGGAAVAASAPVTVAPPDQANPSPTITQETIPTPPPITPATEHVAPVVKLKSARCARTACVVYLTVTDAAPSSGIVRAEGRVVNTYRTWCGSGRKRKRCTKAQTRTLVSVVAGPGLYRLTTPRLKGPGKRKFTLTAVDVAGNRPAKATTVSR